ncbi:hypothetical protein BH09PLA1_BH09PLA1_24600 [soil metagenome]
MGGSALIATAALPVLLSPVNATPQAAAPTAVWVFLKDKGFADDLAMRQAVSDFTLSLDPSALARRERRGSITASIQDLPVSTSYADALAASGAKLRVKSAWLNAVSIEATPQQLARIQTLGFVDHLQPVARMSSPMATPEPAGSITELQSSGGTRAGGPEDFYGASSAQLNQINIPAVHALGYTGTGMKIGILDTGFKRTHQFFNEPGHVLNLIAEHDFLDGDNDTSETTNGQHTHGTSVLGCIGAYKPNQLVGGAYNASFLLAKTEDVSQEVIAEEDNWVAGLEFLESNGADVVTSSLGYIDWYTQNQLNGHTAITTVAAAAAAQRGLPITNAAGNEGHDSNPATSHLIAPADADLLITVGAIDAGGTVAIFSSDGPTADGRVKPELMARGVSAATVTANSDGTTTLVDGTSFATPITAAAVTLIVQAHPDWSVEQLRYALFTTASRGGSFDPQYVYGYGTVNALAAVQLSFDKFYTLGSSGQWNTGGNWTSATVPFALNNVFITPTNGLTVTGPTAAARINKLTVNTAGSGIAQLNLSSNATFTVDRTITIGNRGAIVQSAGTLVVGQTIPSDGTLNVSGGTASLANIVGNGTLAIGTNARVNLRPNGSISATSRMKSLTIAGSTNAWTGRLNLADNDLVVDYTGASPIATITNQIKTARGTGVWSGNGITSSLANANRFALGVAEASDVLGVAGGTFSGQGVDGTAVLVKFTYYGDADLNGIVNFDDYSRIDGGFNNGGNKWSRGDFDYNGVINFDDYSLIDLAFNTQSGSLRRAMSFLDGDDRSDAGMEGPALQLVIAHFEQFGEAYASSFLSAVPEPASLMLFGAMISVRTLRRRRRD